MAVLKILTYPDPRLRKKSVPVEKIDKRIEKLLDDMAETMYDAPGIGLAAPQVGVNLRVIVVDISPREENSPGLIELVNPEIVLAEGEQIGEEGCLSIPGFVSEVRRKARVVVRGLDRKGKPVEIEGTGLLARAFQHEIDHLDGILFIDRLSRLKRELFKKKLEKVFGKEESYAAF
ncbi:MAG: peptide deformylase [Deltaproteobacteria bacterium]|jgi:peptide deformylase|nr:MAG: peptide deformylase [Deltaproteobacteria bacterium]